MQVHQVGSLMGCQDEGCVVLLASGTKLPATDVYLTDFR